MRVTYIINIQRTKMPWKICYNEVPSQLNAINSQGMKYTNPSIFVLVAISVTPVMTSLLTSPFTFLSRSLSFLYTRMKNVENFPWFKNQMQ